PALPALSRSLKGEFLHAPPGRRFADVEIALRVDGHPVWAQELSRLTSAAPELADDFEIGSPQDPDFMVRAVREVQPLLLRVRRQDDDERRAGGKCRGGDDLLRQELALMIEHLEAIAATIGDVDLAVLRSGQSVNGRELLRQRAAHHRLRIEAFGVVWLLS